MLFKSALVAAAIASLLAGSAAPALAKSPLEPGAKPQRQCFWTRNVNNFASNDDRIAALDPWLEHYNTGRRHSALEGKPPISRLQPTS